MKQINKDYPDGIDFRVAVSKAILIFITPIIFLVLFSKAYSKFSNRCYSINKLIDTYKVELKSVALKKVNVKEKYVELVFTEDKKVCYCKGYRSVDEWFDEINKNKFSKNKYSLDMYITDFEQEKLSKIFWTSGGI